MLAYAVDGVGDLDDIRSLEYHSKTDPPVREWLEKSEDPNGSSVFTGQNNKGMGFVDPIYVRDEKLKAIRWNPWADEMKTLSEEVTEAVLDALGYALLEPSEEVRQMLAQVGWSLPLIRDVGGERYKFTRKSLFWQGGRGREDEMCPWSAGDNIATSIWQVVDVLAGKGNSVGRLMAEGTEWRGRIHREQRVFRTEVLPEIISRRDQRDLWGNAAQQYRGLFEQAKKSGPDRPWWEKLVARITDREKPEGV